MFQHHEQCSFIFREQCTPLIRSPVLSNRITEITSRVSIYDVASFAPPLSEFIVQFVRKFCFFDPPPLCADVIYGSPLHPYKGTHCTSVQAPFLPCFVSAYLCHPVPVLLRAPLCGPHLLLCLGPPIILGIILFGRPLRQLVGLALPCSLLNFLLLLFSVG